MLCVKLFFKKLNNFLIIYFAYIRKVTGCVIAGRILYSIKALMIVSAPSSIGAYNIRFFAVEPGRRMPFAPTIQINIG